MRKTLYSCYALCVAVILSFVGTTQVKAQAITENFDDITTLPGSGWSLQNLSTPVGSTNWFQGSNVGAGGPFDAYNGAANAYIGANYNNTGSTGTISNWLLMPNRTLRNGDVITFYSRKPTGQDYPDRLEVRLSTNGASTNAGTSAATVGDFTTLLLSINPTLVTGVYPTVWTQYTITISGLPAPTSGRVGFRYFVTSAGSLGNNSDYIGIDAFTYTPYVCPTITVGPGSLPNGTAGVAYSQSITQTGSLGAPGYAVTAGALPPGTTLSNSGTISGTPTATGTFNFSITVTDASGCSGSASNAITVVCPTGVASLNLAPDVVCSNDGLITLAGGAPAGGTYSGTGVAGGQFDPGAGTQTITYDYTDPYGCAHSATDVLTVNTAPTVTLAPLANACSYEDVTLSGGSPAGGIYFGPGVVAGVFDASAGTQTITYTYTDANGCSNDANQTLTVNAAPTVDLGADITQCGGTATIDAVNAGATYLWSDNSTNQTLTISSSGTYSVVITDANTCTATDDVDVTINTVPTVDLGNDVTQCGGTATLDAGNAGASYLWSDNSTNQTLTVSASGTYSVVITDANTCTATDEVDVTINTVPTVDLGNDVTQCGGTATLDAGNAGASYLWSDNSTSQTLTVSASGTYSVVITDANTCTATDEVDVTINTVPTVDLGADVTQCGGTATLDAGNAGATYLWSDNSTSQTLTVSASGTYSVVITDANTCTATDEVDITINTVPTVDLGADVTQCGGTATLDAGNAGATYLWSDNSTNQTLTVSATGTYSVVITDANTCTATDEVDVTINTVVAVDLGADVTQCGGTATLNAGNAGATFEWSDNSTDQTLDVTVSGTYSVTVTDANTCTGTDEVDVTINTVPTVDLGADVTQCGGTTTLDAGNAGSTYAWSDNSTSQTLVVSATATVEVTITDANSCTATDEVDVTINTITTVDLGADVIQCGGTTTLDAGNAGATYAWSDNSTDQTLDVTASGTFSVTVTDANTCTGTDEVDVTINTIPTVDLGADVTQCGGTATLDAGNAGATYAWSDNSTAQTLVVSATGTVNVTVTDANNCTATDAVDVTINANPTVTFATLAPVCDNAGTVTLSGGAPAGGTYSGTGVTGGSFDPASGTQTITYTYTDANTCVGSATQTQTVDICSGIKELETAEVTCFPNPATTALTVTVSSIQTNVVVRMVDVTGKLVANDEQYNVSGAYRHIFDITNFAQGVYVIEIRNGSNFTTKRISKQ